MSRHFCVAAVAALTFQIAFSDYLIPERVRFITASRTPEEAHETDAISNYLFRGNMPLTYGSLCDPKQTLDWDGLGHALQHDLPNAYTLYPNYSILDISLVTAKTACPDRHDLDRELAFAEKHPDQLEVLNWVLLGQPRSPLDEPADRRKALVESLPTWMEDRLPQRVEMLHKLLHTHHNRPLVLYVHCEQGQDRTGQIIGAYMLRFLGWTWPEVRKYNQEVTGHGPIPKHFNALMYYCLYLETQGMKLECMS